MMSPMMRAAIWSPRPSELEPLDEERVRAFAELLARHENSLPQRTPRHDDFGFWAYARVLAAKEMDGEITYEEMEETLFPRVYPHSPMEACTEYYLL